MPNVQCTLDGVTQISGQNGVVSFTSTQGPHHYEIKAERYKVGPRSVDPFSRPIQNQGTIIVEWLLDPTVPWPETSIFYLSVYMVEGAPSPELNKVIPIAIGLGVILLLTGKK
jgi:hypothetical protein